MTRQPPDFMFLRLQSLPTPSSLDFINEQLEKLIGRELPIPFVPTEKAEAKS